MDILDIILAKSLTPQGQINTYASRAQRAVNNSNTVLDNAREAVENIDTITQQTQDNNDLALETLERAEEALSRAEQSSVDAETIAAIDTKAEEAKQAAQEAITDLDVVEETTSTAKVKKTRVRKKGIQSAYETVKNYISTGMNDDGSMTQKAITTELNKLNTRINNLPSGGSGGIFNLGVENEGKLVSIDENGNIKSSEIKESSLFISELISGFYTNEEILGLEIDYENKNFKRLQGASNKINGEDFDSYSMYGGRKRCIVNENGQIEHFLNQNDTLDFIEDKRIMVYQPAFYYLRIPLQLANTENGILINKEQIYISSHQYPGFKIHPIFLDNNNNIIKYILLPAYESGTLRADGTFEKNNTQNINFSTDKLVSIIETKPITGGVQEFTLTAAKQMAHNNGDGWEITDLRFESLNQMLMCIEYGSLNLQNTFNKGISEIPNISSFGTDGVSSITGSTHNLLNSSGQADSTTAYNGTVYTTEGQCAISYRGMENPYGNSWRFIDNILITNNTVQYKAEPFNFKLPLQSKWIAAFGYDKNYDWAFIPIENNNNANSIVPVGDFVFISNEDNAVGLMGGLSNGRENCGPFYYAFHISQDAHIRSGSARVMFIPTANSYVEEYNYNMWFNS